MVVSGRPTASVTRRIDARWEGVHLLAMPALLRPTTPDEGVECYGPEASAYTEQVLTGRRVELELDVEHRDKYGRLLAYVVLDGHRFTDCSCQNGYARIVIPPNGVYART